MSQATLKMPLPERAIKYILTRQPSPVVLGPQSGNSFGSSDFSRPRHRVEGYCTENPAIAECRMTRGLEYVTGSKDGYQTRKATRPDL